jgi:DNA modification methylase
MEEAQGGEFVFELRYDLWRLATFLPNENYPVHRWFHFKEGFSRDLVELLARRFGLSEGDVVLDPFVGSGTTPLTCMELGLEGIGIDASPLMVMISLAKTRRYDAVALEASAQRVLERSRPVRDVGSVSPLVRKAFRLDVLRELLGIREEVMSVEDEDARLFLTLALMKAAMSCSYAVKDGSVIRIEKRSVPPLSKVFRSTVRSMIEDVRRIALRSGPAQIYLGDAREMNVIGDGSVDAVITSPPYLNKIEYTRVYEMEMELFAGGARPELLRSYIGLSPRIRRVPPEAEGLPDSAIAYFVDMEQVLAEVMRVLREGGRAAFVVSGGVYPGMVVEVDVILARIARRLGFEVERILALGKRVATSGRVHRIGESRESAVILRKPS